MFLFNFDSILLYNAFDSSLNEKSQFHQKYLEKVYLHMIKIWDLVKVTLKRLITFIIVS